MRDSDIVFSICYQIGVKQLNQQCPISEDWWIRCEETESVVARKSRHL